MRKKLGLLIPMLLLTVSLSFTSFLRTQPVYAAGPPSDWGDEERAYVALLCLSVPDPFQTGGVIRQSEFDQSNLFTFDVSKPISSLIKGDNQDNTAECGNITKIAFGDTGIATFKKSFVGFKSGNTNYYRPNDSYVTKKGNSQDPVNWTYDISKLSARAKSILVGIFKDKGLYSGTNTLPSGLDIAKKTSDYQKYILQGAFDKCYDTTTTKEFADTTIDGKYYVLKDGMHDDSGQKVGLVVDTSWGDGKNGEINCSTAAAAVKQNPDILTTLKDKNGNDIDRLNSTNTDSGADAAPSCELAINNPLSWIICPAITLMQGAVNIFYNAANTALNVKIDGNPNDPHSTYSGFYTAWSNLRNIANVLFVVALLIIIISQLIVGKM